MSALAAPLRRPVAPAAPEQPRLRPVEVGVSRAQRRARPKTVYAVATILALALIFTAQLLLSIALSDGAYRISALQEQQRELVRVEQALGEQLGVRDSTQLLAQNAATLGMVPASSPYFLDLETGAVASAPGSADPFGCGGSCGLVPNALLTGVPLIDPAARAPAAQQAASAQPAATSAAPAPAPAPSTDMLPAPVTQ